MSNTIASTAAEPDGNSSDSESEQFTTGGTPYVNYSFRVIEFLTGLSISIDGLDQDGNNVNTDSSNILNITSARFGRRVVRNGSLTHSGLLSVLHHSGAYIGLSSLSRILDGHDHAILTVTKRRCPDGYQRLHYMAFKRSATTYNSGPGRRVWTKMGDAQGRQSPLTLDESTLIKLCDADEYPTYFIYVDTLPDPATARTNLQAYIAKTHDGKRPAPSGDWCLPLGKAVANSGHAVDPLIYQMIQKVLDANGPQREDKRDFTTEEIDEVATRVANRLSYLKVSDRENIYKTIITAMDGILEDAVSDYSTESSSGDGDSEDGNADDTVQPDMATPPAVPQVDGKADTKVQPKAAIPPAVPRGDDNVKKQWFNFSPAVERVRAEAAAIIAGAALDGVDNPAPDDADPAGNDSMSGDTQSYDTQSYDDDDTDGTGAPKSEPSE